MSHNQSKLQVAIVQHRFIKGGRLHVLIDITRVLNKLGIIPDFISFDFEFTIEDIHKSYGNEVQLQLRQIRGMHLPQDFSILLFHFVLRRYIKEYDLVINSSNSLLFLPNKPTFLTYMHYPREGRIYTDSVDIHLPNEHPPLVSKLGLGKRMLRLIYNLFGTNPKHAIICNSGFTYEAFRSFYDVGNNVPIIYPGVETSSYEIDKAELTKNPKQVIALGRIALNKRQLEQIKLASKMPDYEFRIVGFIANQAYYDKCVEYIKSHQITNVHLHPNLAFPKMVALLQQSKYFLHTMIKEPFGITAIQAVAAGCIPIVHDSGGQRETINLPELRYKEIDEIPDMIKQLEVLSDTEIKSKIEYLQTHVKNNFSEDIFQKRMTEYLHKIIEEITATKS